MSDRTPIAAKTASRSSSMDPKTERDALHLRMEIDRLALLLDQVKRQSDQIQAAADAIGHKLNLD